MLFWWFLCHLVKSFLSKFIQVCFVPNQDPSTHPLVLIIPLSLYIYNCIFVEIKLSPLSGLIQKQSCDSNKYIVGTPRSRSIEKTIRMAV